MKLTICPADRTHDKILFCQRILSKDKKAFICSAICPEKQDTSLIMFCINAEQNGKNKTKLFCDLEVGGSKN